MSNAEIKTKVKRPDLVCLSLNIGDVYLNAKKKIDDLSIPSIAILNSPLIFICYSNLIVIIRVLICK